MNAGNSARLILMCNSELVCAEYVGALLTGAGTFAGTSLSGRASPKARILPESFGSTLHRLERARSIGGKVSKLVNELPFRNDASSRHRESTSLDLQTLLESTNLVAEHLRQK